MGLAAGYDEEGVGTGFQEICNLVSASPGASIVCWMYIVKFKSNGYVDR